MVRLVRAEAQSRVLAAVLDKGLTDDEASVVRRGRNAVKRSPSRFASSSSASAAAGPGVYQDSTSLEALIGHLYLTDPEGERTREVMETVRGEVVRMQEEGEGEPS